MSRALSIVLSLLFMLNTAVSSAQTVASVSISQTTGADTICAGSNVAFTATAINGGTTQTYRWYMNGALVSGVSGPVYATTTLPSGSPYIYCTMTSSLSGVIGNPASSNIIYVKVNSLPTATISGTRGICPGDTATLNIRLTGTAPYSGMLNDSTFFSGTTDTITIPIAPAGTFSYRINAVSDNNHCSASALSSSATLTVWPRPSASDSGMANVCAGSATNITITASGTAPFHGTLSNGSAFTGTSNTFTVPVTPQHDTVYVITALTDAHCAALPSALTDSTLISIIARPVAMVSDTDSVCFGSAGHITFTLSNGAPWQVNYSSGSQNYTMAVASSPLTIYLSPAATGSYHITSVTGGGCTTRPSDISGTGLIVVNPIPRAIISPLTDSSQCLNNNTFNFNGSRSTVSSGTISSWNWHYGSQSNDTASGSAPRIHFSDTVSNQTVLLTVTSNKGCSSDTSINISVRPSPSAAFYLDNNAICLGNPVSAKAIKDSTYTYLWNWGTNADTCHCDSIAHTYTSVNNKRVFLTVINNAGCKDTLSNTIEVHPSPIASFTIADSVQCFRNNNFVFTDHSSIPSGQTYGDLINGYSWDFGDHSGPNYLSSPTHLYSNNILNAYTVTETVTTSFGCTDSFQRNVFVFKTPSLNISNSNISDTVCAGTAYTLTAHSDAAHPAYLWSTNDTTTSISAVADSIVLTSNVKTYKLIVTDIAGNRCTDTISHMVTSVPNPTQAIINNGQLPVVCDSSTVHFEVSNVNDSTHYFWYTSPALPISGQNSANCNITFAGIDSALIFVNAINIPWGCTTSQHKMIYTGHGKAPSVMINALPDLRDTTLIALALPDSGITYQWGYDGSSFSEFPISGATTQDLLLDSGQYSGKYWVIVTDTSTKCSTKVYYKAPVTTTDIIDINGAEAIVSVYPNPTTDEFHINIRSAAAQTWQIQIMDMNGKEISTLQTDKDTNAHQNINAREWAAGSYFIKIISQSGATKVLKLIHE